MILVCHLFSQDHLFEGSCNFMAVAPLMVGHHLAKFGGHSRCGSGDIVFSVAEEEDCKCSCFNRSLHGLKAHGLISY